MGLQVDESLKLMEGTTNIGGPFKTDLEYGPANHGSRAFGNWQSDNAWDVFAEPGSVVNSYTSGTVLKVRVSNKKSGKVFGTQVTVKGNGKYPDIFYTHLKNVKVKPGDKVSVGKKRVDFSTEDLNRYASYCINDVNLTHDLFNRLAAGFPEAELDLIDMTLRMYTQPVLRVDQTLLRNRLDEIKQEKRTLLRGLMDTLQVGDEEEVRKKLASNPQFAAILTDSEIPVPMKISPTTGKETYALAKNDEGFIALLEHEDPFIQQLCAVRLGTRSTIEESRIERFINIGARNRGRLPIPLKYYGAHTGRWAGADAVNFQNLPSRDKQKAALKRSVLAPEGHVVINCDSSQIEARVLAWLAGQNELVKQFANGEDVYSVFASKIYNRPISKANPVERFVGKTCILGLGYGTGAAKLRHTLKTQPPGADLDEDKCQAIVDLYRQTNDKIPKLWTAANNAVKHLVMWTDELQEFSLGEHDALRVNRLGIRLPNGLYIRYPGLHMNENNKLIYKSRKGEVSLWGGSVVENVVQALARIIVGEQMLVLKERYRPVLTVHDAAVIVVPEGELQEALAFIRQVMSTPPKWAAKYCYWRRRLACLPTQQ